MREKPTWPAAATEVQLPLPLPPVPGVRRPTLAEPPFTTCCPCCNLPHRTKAEFMACRDSYN